MSDTSVVFSILATEKVSNTLSKIPGAAAITGAAIGAALMAGIDEAMDQQSAANKLAAQLGATPAEAAHLGQLAGNLYSQNFGDSVADIDDALKTVIQNGLTEGANDAALQAVTGRVITAAKLMGASYDDVSRAVSQMLRTGLAKSADEALDVLVSGMQKGVDKSGDLLDTFNEYPTEFRKLGISGSEAMGLISQALKAGARDSDVAADALKEFAIRAVDGSKTTSDGFKALGLDAKKMGADIGAGGDRANAALDLTLDRLRAMPDPVQRSQAAVKLFGTQAEDLGDALYAMDPSHAVDALGQVAGAADRAGDSLNSGAGAKLETFKRKLKEAFVDLLEQKVIPVVEGFANWAQAHPGWADGLTAGFFGLSIALWAVNSAMLANPVTWIVIAFAAAIAIMAYGVYYMVSNFMPAWNYVWGILKQIGHWFAGPFAGFFVDTYHTIMHWADMGHQFVMSRWNNLVANVTSIPGRIRAAASGMWDGVKDAFRGAMNWIIGRWNNLHFSIPSVDFLGFHVPGFTLNLPDIPMMAAGGVITRGGMVGMNEKGAEVVSLPTGAAVYPHGSVPASTGPAGGGQLTMRVVGSGGLAQQIQHAARTGELQLFDADGRPITIYA